MVTTQKQPKKLKPEDINRYEIAQALEVSHSEISRIFSGDRTPSLGLFKRIAEYLSVSLDELQRFIDSPELKAANEAQKQKRST